MTNSSITSSLQILKVKCVLIEFIIVVTVIVFDLFIDHIVIVESTLGRFAWSTVFLPIRLMLLKPRSDAISHQVLRVRSRWTVSGCGVEEMIICAVCFFEICFDLP